MCCCVSVFGKEGGERDRAEDAAQSATRTRTLDQTRTHTTSSHTRTDLAWGDGGHLNYNQDAARQALCDWIDGTKVC